MKNGCVTGSFNSGDIYSKVTRTLKDRFDMGWLKKGDKILIKVSGNSSNRHPAVTSPVALDIMIRFFKESGAGEIIVGDQSGVQHVRFTPKKRKSSTRKVFAKNGLLQVIEKHSATPCFFDEKEWDSYFQPEMDFNNHWNNRLFIPSVIKETDHIVYLPRIASHCLAGYTGALKNAVGWLRDDSRMYLHADGTSFYKKISEINYVPEIRNKLRLAVTIAGKALLHFGPDMGKVYDFKDTVLLASENLIDHDYVMSALLNRLNNSERSVFSLLPWFHFPKSKIWNGFLVRSVWGRNAMKNYTGINRFNMDGIPSEHPVLKHYMDISGYFPAKINVNISQETEELRNLLKSIGGETININ